MRNKSTAAVLSRLKSVTNTDTDTGLSTALGISPQTLSSWKSRESTPYAICVDIAERLDVSLDWLLMGEGPATRVDGPSRVECDDSLQPMEAEVIALLRELPEEDQRTVRSLIEEKKRVRGLEKRLADLSMVLADIKRPA